MKEHGCRRAACKKKFCAILIASLFIEGVCFQQGEVILSAQGMVGDKTAADSLDKEEMPRPEMTETEVSMAEKSEEEISRTDSPETSIPDTGVSNPEESGTEDQESRMVEPETAASEITESEVQEMEKTESEPETSETGMSTEDTKEAGFSNPGNSEIEIPDQQETKTDIQESKETKDYGSEVPDPTSSYRVLSDEKQLELEGLTCLQIPEKLKVIIDPWEIDEKGQIYSEPFAVKNTGESSGILTLSFTCTLNKADGVSIRETGEGLRYSEEKLIYMKAVLGNGEECIFTEEGAECQVELQPEEELSLWFEGNVNENAEEPWKDGDVEIKGVYSWEEDENQDTEIKENSSETEKVFSEEETLPTKEEKESSGEETVPMEIKQESSEEEKKLPEETEQESSKEETLSTEMKGDSSDGEEALPPEIEKEASSIEETLPAEAGKETGREQAFPDAVGEKNSEENRL